MRSDLTETLSEAQAIPERAVHVTLIDDGASVDAVHTDVCSERLHVYANNHRKHHMKPPSGLQSAASPPAPPDRKRKRPHRAPSSQEQQQTLHSCFSGQQKPHINGAPSSPNKKRPRENLPDRPSTPRGRLAAADMYSFSSRSPTANGNGVIDLTNGTPPTSPQARRVNGAVKGRSGINPHAGAKKLVVKNLKPSTNWDSKAYLERVWGQLDDALARIFKDEHDGFSKEDLYRGVESVCKQNGASTLFSRLEGRCRTHVERDMGEPLIVKADQDSVSVLRAVLQQWQRWKEQMVTIRAIFFFLDRSYLLQSSKPTLSELTPQLFRDLVFSNPALKPKVVDGACDLVATARTQTQGLEESLFRDAVEMFHELSVYNASFEPRFLQLTQDYVATWSDEMVVEKPIPEYVALAERTIASELGRCEDFALDSSTRRDLLALLEDHLIQRKEQDLTEYQALAPLLDNNATKDTAALYGLLARRKLGSKLRPSFEKWVDETGTSIVLANETDDMIIHLLSLKRRMDYVWQNCFQRDESLGHGLRESFAIFMNKTKKGDSTHGTDNTKVGEMIAKYVDQLLRGGAKAIPDVLTARRASSITGQRPDVPNGQPAEEENDDDEMDEDSEINIQLDQVLDLFRFVQGKAIFEAFYKKDLARRLLMGRSASADAERSMLTRLKTECGSAFTQNLEQMFKDVELAREEMQSYKQRLEDRIGYEKGKNVDLSVNILSAAAWPSYPDIPVVIPANIKRAIDDFELHYKSKHSGRKLDWKHALAHCQMRATFNKGVKELVVSSFQAIVLVLFNGLTENDHLTYQHILSETGLRELCPLSTTISFC